MTLVFKQCVAVENTHGCVCTEIDLFFRKHQHCFSLCLQVAVPPRRKPVRGRRRQLVFADPQVQISNKTMKEQTGNPQAETKDLVIKQTDPHCCYLMHIQ